jgi:hypothetical protein
MARYFDFAIVRLAPDNARDERINVGVVVTTDHGLDIHIARRLEKVRAISAAIDTPLLRELLENLKLLDAQLLEAGVEKGAERLAALGRIGPISISSPGRFSAETDDVYEARLQTIMTTMVEPEPAPARIREKRSPLFSQVKRVFRQERVLAQPGETLGSHRIVTSFELDEGLVADLVLKNGAMHIVETVDASTDGETARRALGAIGISALVLERARMKYPDKSTTTRLVYSASSNLEKVAMPSLEAAQHQGASLVNWASADDRNRFVNSLAGLADPVSRKGRAGSGHQRKADQLRFI